MALLPPGYRLRQGQSLDRAALLRAMRRTYRELYPEQSFDHLAETVQAYFSSQTPLWWVELSPTEALGQTGTFQSDQGPEPESDPRGGLSSSLLDQSRGPSPVGCLWMGTAVDQVSGLRHAHIFLLYVAPEHRRLGLARGLMAQAEGWAQQRGDRQISLQVFHHNQAALGLYSSLGYLPQSVALVKPLSPQN